MRRPLLLAVLGFAGSACSSPDAPPALNQTGENGSPATERSSSFTRLDLGTLGGRSSYASGISNSGTVVGWSETAEYATHAFRWSPASGMVDLSSLPGDKASRAVAILDTKTGDEPEIVGVSGDGTSWTPVVWPASGSIAPLPVPSTTDIRTRYPTAFNSAGQVVGWDASGGLQHGWVWSVADGKIDLSANVPGAIGEGSAVAINTIGQVLLTGSTSACMQTPDCWRTFIWAKSTGYQPLATPFAKDEASVTGFDLNERGTVVGWTAFGGRTPVPYRWTAANGFVLLTQYAGSASAYGYATAINSVGTVVGADFETMSGTIVASIWTSAGGITKLSPNDPNPSVAIDINDAGTIAGWAAVSANANHAVVWTPGPSGSISSIISPTAVTVRVTAVSSSCLGPKSVAGSRQALLDCVAKADRRR